MEKYVEFKEIGLDMEVEIYDVSDNKVDTGIVTNVYDEESYVLKKTYHKFMVLFTVRDTCSSRC